mmetsp:Transcript_6737/g.10307  ORF Transcript_6737/g.10307 Transcript_6737/m.10307 type:complete len:155 (-) Transcript_6737:222-686(-)
MFYGPEIWDPWLILAQMGILQSSFYLVTGLLIMIFETVIGGSQPKLNQLLSASQLDLHKEFSYSTMLAFLASSLICAVICAHVVDRAWQCLDFSSTVYGFHFILCWLHSGFPVYWEWWAINLVSMIVMVLLSEYWLVIKEQEPIELDKIDRLKV